MPKIKSLIKCVLTYFTHLITIANKKRSAYDDDREIATLQRPKSEFYGQLQVLFSMHFIGNDAIWGLLLQGQTNSFFVKLFDRDFSDIFSNDVGTKKSIFFTTGNRYTKCEVDERGKKGAKNEGNKTRNTHSKVDLINPSLTHLGRS